MAPSIDLYYDFLTRNGVRHPQCELCSSRHCWPHCAGQNHYQNVVNLAEEISDTLPWAQARNHFYQHFQMADCMVRFNHLDGSIDACVVSHLQPPPPTFPLPYRSAAALQESLREPPPPSDPPPQQCRPQFAAPPLEFLERPPPSYPPPHQGRLFFAELGTASQPSDSTAATGSNEEHIGSSARHDDLAPAPQVDLTQPPLPPLDSTTPDDPWLHMGVASSQPPSLGAQWHLRVHLDDDDVGLERAIEHLREEIAAAHARGVRMRLDIRLVQLEV